MHVVLELARVAFGVSLRGAVPTLVIFVGHGERARRVVGVNDRREPILIVIHERSGEGLGRAVRLPIDARFRRFVAVAVVRRSANVARGVGDFGHASEGIELRDGRESARIDDGHLVAASS
jgi:hypothetical protein